MEPYIVTTALTYANGPLHLGHMLEYIQVDIWHRTQQMQNREGYFIAGSDAHGTPIMLSAECEGITPEELIKRNRNSQLVDLQKFGISIDTFGSTHSDTNKKITENMYQQIIKAGDIDQRDIMQAFDSNKNMFLPDRFIKGECPRCHAKNQYGDNCEACGATYSPTDLINPTSVLSNTTPEQKKSKHYFFRLDQHQNKLDAWLTPKHIPEQMCKKIREWFKDGLQAWDISRDAPYFGFLIPGTTNKYFYVWLDAPMGYISFFKDLCDEKKNIDFNAFWKKDSQHKLYHCIGKDVFYFHALFWPAILDSANMRMPSHIFTHGFLTINGEKMSKSRGTFIQAGDYLNHLEPDYFRYYLACKLSNSIEDIDFNFDDFIARSNSDLIGKYINIASRCAKFIHQHGDGMLSEAIDDTQLLQQFIDQHTSILTHYNERNTHHAMREIMSLADLANQYIDQHKPWTLAKQDGKSERIIAICSQGINMFRLISLYLKPVIPSVIERAEVFLNIQAMTWDDVNTPLVNHQINEFKPLLGRIKADEIANLRQQPKHHEQTTG